MSLLTDRWTSADASQLFLCAFLVTIPTATTLKITHDTKKRKLQDDMQTFLIDLQTISAELDKGIFSLIPSAD